MLNNFSSAQCFLHDIVSVIIPMITAGISHVPTMGNVPGGRFGGFHGGGLPKLLQNLRPLHFDHNYGLPNKR
jgi:hypothetical protein